jgi:hypothetical protein
MMLDSAELDDGYLGELLFDKIEVSVRNMSFL